MDMTVLIGVVCILGGALLGWWLRSRKKMTLEEWLPPYWDGYAQAIKNASGLIEDFGHDDRSRPFATRWAKHIRGLYESIPQSIRETQK